MYTYQRLFDFSKAVFIAMGHSKKMADTAATVLVSADMRGVDSHGVARLKEILGLPRKRKTIAAMTGKHVFGQRPHLLEHRPQGIAFEHASADRRGAHPIEVWQSARCRGFPQLDERNQRYDLPVCTMRVQSEQVPGRRTCGPFQLNNDIVGFTVAFERRHVDSTEQDLECRRRVSHGDSKVVGSIPINVDL